MAAEASPLVAFAQQVGLHALSLFLAGLIASTLAAGLACLLLQQRRARRRGSGSGDTPTVARMVAGLAAGFVSILAAAILFVAIAQRLGPGRTMGLADQALAEAIGQQTPVAALHAFSLLTRLGDPPVLTLLCAVVAVLLWRQRRRLLAIGWLLALAGNAVLNPMLKQIFERARPLHDHGLAQATGFSFPSGHSSGAMVAYGMLLYVALRTLPVRWHPAATMGAIALVLTIACSRVFLQVHFASDVVAGLLSGLAWLGVCVMSLEFARHRQGRKY